MSRTSFVFFFLSLLCLTSSDNNYADFTSEVFQEPTVLGTLASFWDTNNDRITDIIVWVNDKDRHEVLFYQSSSGLQQKHPILYKNDDLKIDIPGDRDIDGVFPGDFNGDLVLDIIVATRKDKDDERHLYIAWGNDNSSTGNTIRWELQAADEIKYDEKPLVLEREPTIFDYNGDTVPDLIVQVEGQLWVLNVDLNEKPDSRNWNKTLLLNSTEFGDLKKTHSNAFVDIDDDLIADIVLTMKKGSDVSLVVMEHLSPKDTFGKIVPEAPFKAPVVIPLNKTSLEMPATFEIGQIVFVDFNDDQKMDALIPVIDTTTSTTKTTKILMFDWAHNSTVNITPEMGKFNILPGNDEFPLRVHMGDYDQDGYVDGLAIMEDGEGNKQVVLLHNEKCNPNDGCQDRKFVIITDKTTSLTKLNDGETPVLAAFFDAWDDGFLDILVITEKEKDGAKTRQIRAYRNQLGIDATWIKAMAYTGFCDLPSVPAARPCPDKFNIKALSLPVCGATIIMDTTRGDGGSEKVTSGLLSQFAHFALQMPTTIFGLGRSPNFVDKITVGLAPVVGQRQDRHTKLFEQTIPNSAVVISPKPLTKPAQWRAFIYVTPSSAMLETGIVLSVVFALLAILVGLLHWKEKKEDQKEKLVEMQRFHFDAM